MCMPVAKIWYSKRCDSLTLAIKGFSLPKSARVPVRKRTFFGASMAAGSLTRAP
jgi:hypothetical protein